MPREVCSPAPPGMRTRWLGDRRARWEVDALTCRVGVQPLSRLTILRTARDAWGFGGDPIEENWGIGGSAKHAASRSEQFRAFRHSACLVDFSPVRAGPL